jgi:hypothetical protein
LDEVNEDEIDVEEKFQWRLESRLLQQYEEYLQAEDKNSGDQPNQFSIGMSHSLCIELTGLYQVQSFIEEERETLELPPVLQEDLQHSFNKEKVILQDRIDFLEKEQANSQVAFDKYRDRARESLMKTANELNTAEAKIKSLKEQMKVYLSIITI